MKKLPVILAVAVVLAGLTAPASTEVIRVDVTEDGYCAMCGLWYMDREYVKTFAYKSGYDTFAYTKFDIEGDLAGITSDTIVEAKYTFYKTEKAGHGYDPVPVGKTCCFDVNAYKDVYTEADCTYTNYVPETHLQQAHTVAAQKEWVSIDITSIVKGWLDYIESGGIEGYANHGIEINKFDTCPEGDIDCSNYGWYWRSMESTMLDENGNPTKPYLEVVIIPEPVTLSLLSIGALVLSVRRRRRK